MDPLRLNPPFKMQSQVIFHFLLPPHAPYSSLHFTFDDLIRKGRLHLLLVCLYFFLFH